MAEGYKISGLDETNKLIGGLTVRLINRKPAMLEMAHMFVSSMQKNFQVGGRPVRWPRSQRVSGLRRKAFAGLRSGKFSRAEAVSRGGQTLLGSGRLMKSITNPQVTESKITIGSNLPYARIHQEGFDGSQNVRGHVRRVKSRNVFGKEQRVSKKTGKAYTARAVIAQGIAHVKPFAREMKMPARPYLVVQTEDMQKSVRILEHWVIVGRIGS